LWYTAVLQGFYSAASSEANGQLLAFEMKIKSPRDFRINLSLLQEKKARYHFRGFEIVSKQNPQNYETLGEKKL